MRYAPLFLPWGLLLAIVLPAAAAPGPFYPVSTIPAALRENAHAVVRLHETQYEVRSAGEASVRVHYVVTILDAHARQQAWLKVPYDKLTRFESLSGTLYDAQGERVDRIRNGDIQDRSAFDGFSLYSDNRMKVAGFNREQYPYTVEFSYEYTDRLLMSYPTFMPQDEEHLAVEEASLTVTLPAGMDLRYREVLPALAPAAGVASAAEGVADAFSPLTREMEAKDGGKQYRWRLHNLAPVQVEPLSGNPLDYVPRVLTAPNTFKVAGYEGDARDWSSFGQWFFSLNEGRGALPPQTVAQVEALVAGADDAYTRVDRVYRFMQNHTRYVSIQLGIGGYQPFPATDVAEKGYGDCKALSSYTQALLKAAGVASHYTLIRAGDDAPDILTNFPSIQFNHAVVCVPLDGDTLWLECTDQNNATGYAGTFTGDRHALAITPEGGKLVSTPTYPARSNQQTRTVAVQLDEAGNATARVQTRYTGLQQEDRHRLMHNETPENQRKWLYKHVDIPSFELQSFALAEAPARVPAVEETLALTVRRCASRSGKRLFLKPNLMNRWTRTLPATTDRRAPVVWSYPFYDADTVRYQLPAGFTVEHPGESVRYQTPFGTYAATLRQEGDQLVYVRTLEMPRGTYPATDYAAFLAFWQDIARADQQQIVLVAD